MEGFENIKSNKKIAKKAKQMYRREVRDIAKKQVDGLYKTFEEHVRPKPRYVPEWIWRGLQRIVLMHYVK
jgi:hypothetical protein